MNKTALLLGATGLVGSRCLNYLLNSNNYKTVKIIVRRSINNPNPKLKEYIADYSTLHETGDAFICDDVFCCLGTTIKKAGSKENFKKVDLEYPIKAASLALQNGAEKYLIISSIGADKNSGNFYLKVKGEVEDSLQKLGYKLLVILRPSLLLGERNELRLGEKAGEIISRIFPFVFIGRLKKYKPVSADDVAKVMVSFADKTNGVVIIESDKITDEVHK